MEITSHGFKNYAALSQFSSKNGILEIGGISICKIVEKYGTPLYIYDGNIIENSIQNIKNHFPNFQIYYSIKANPSLGIVSFLNKMGCGAEVASSGEIEIALKSRIDPNNIIFAGPAKTYEELYFAINLGIKSINVESLRELNTIDEIAFNLNKKVDVAIRINTKVIGINAIEVMVGPSSRFGIDIDKFVKEFSNINLRNTRIIGIHIYTGSQFLDENIIINNFQKCIDVAFELRQLIPNLKYIFFGGGFGVPNQECEKELNFHEINKQISRKISQYKIIENNYKLGIELGRYIVANSGIFVTKIIDIKDSGGRCYISTDGGMNNFIRPVFMRTHHPTKIINKLGYKEKVIAEICGPLCTPIDVLSHETPIPEPNIDDLIGYFNAGAYGLSMSMQEFLSHNTVKEVFIYKSSSQIIRYPFTIQDRLRFQNEINI